jgi:RNA polymerase sigma-70 factor (ECF subfamily)
MPLPNSPETVVRAQNGDREALGALYDEYHAGVFRFLWARVGERQVAEDLTGDVFLRMLNSLPQYRPMGGIPFQAWLYGIARHRLVDYYRQDKNRATTSLEAAPLAADDELGASAERHLTLETVMQALTGLEPAQREVIGLRFINGLSLRETAQAMGRSEGAVKALQHRALAAVRSLVAEKII